MDSYKFPADEGFVCSTDKQFALETWLNGHNFMLICTFLCKYAYITSIFIKAGTAQQLL
jgi:hypothetical protein